MTSYIHHIVIKVINLTTRLPPEGFVMALRPRVPIIQCLVTFAILYCAENRVKTRMDTRSKHGINRWSYEVIANQNMNTRSTKFVQTFANFLTCQRFCQHTRSSGG